MPDDPKLPADGGAPEDDGPSQLLIAAESAAERLLGIRVPIPRVGRTPLRDLVILLTLGLSVACSLGLSPHEIASRVLGSGMGGAMAESLPAGARKSEIRLQGGDGGDLRPGVVGVSSSSSSWTPAPMVTR